MPGLSIFSLPRDVSVTALSQCVATAGDVSIHGPVRGARERLDTFDWGLLRAGLVLEYEVAAGSMPTLRLLGPDLAANPLEMRAPRRPEFASDLVSGMLRRRLAPLMGVRMLLPRNRMPGSLHELQVRDRRGKTVARVQLWRPSRRGDCVARVLGVRGYESRAGQVVKRLAAFAEARCLEDDPLWERTDDGTGGVGARLDWTVAGLTPALRTDDALQRALRHYRDVMDCNRPGLLVGRDTEFLHDFRVGLRRSRSLIRGVPDVFPQSRLAPFVEDLAWLASITGPVRDADVHCLVFPDYAAGLDPQGAHALEPMLHHVERVRIVAHRDLVRDIDSARFNRRWRAWQRFLEHPMPRASRQRVGPRPLAETAGPSVVAALRRFRRRGRRITVDSAPAAYHELRKSGKSLRYLVDVFGEFLDPQATRDLIRPLKKLQDLLGEHQDLDVHRAALMRIHGVLADSGELAGETHRAMEQLVQDMALRSAAIRERFPKRFKAFLEACPGKKAFTGRSR